jgi:signal transduction histidine kinase/DNA-binding response OmpR family regulator
VNILIADDDPICRRILQSTLTKWGHEVHAVADGTAALEALSKPDGPRLAVLDWEMPGLAGPEVCRQLRARADRPQPYLLLFTAREGKEHITEGIRAGANDYLSKPLDPNELRVRLDIAIGLLEKSALELASRELERRVDQGVAELAALNVNNERLLASIPCVLIGLDEHGLVAKWNRCAEDAFSLPAPETMGRPFTDLPIRWEDATVPERIVQCGRVNSGVRIENASVVCANRHRVLNLAIAPVLCPGQGMSVGVLVLGEDCTEQQLLKAQLAQAQKLESIGQLAAGIAHEINTPIQYIGDNTNFLADAFQHLAKVLTLYRTAESDPKWFDEAQRAAERADLDYLLEEGPRAIQQTLDGVGHVARIVKAMKEFAHPGTDEKVPVDLNHAIQTVIEVARNEWRYVAEVVTDLDPALPPVPGLPGELNQVLLNLLVNAAHAIREANGTELKGTIAIATRWTANLVEVRISDTGCGIPEAVRGRIFDPFFTTKPVGQGTGQGLAIAHAVVVQRHGGAITVVSEVGKGTTFVVRLPLTATRLLRSEFVKALSTERKLSNPPE